MNYPLDFEEFADELIVAFVRMKYNHVTVLEIIRAFSLLETFDRKFYQDAFIDLITDESIDSIEQQDQFITKLTRMIKEIVEAHEVYVVETISLYEVNEIATGILNISLLEDKQLIVYQVNAMDTEYSMAMTVIGSLCFIEPHELMILITRVETSFIENIRKLCEESNSETQVDARHEHIVKTLAAMIADNEAIGLTMVKAGVPLTNHLQDNLDLLAMGQFPLMDQPDFPSYINARYEREPAQCALDVLSLLLISKDTYQLCLLHLEKHQDILFKKEKTLDKLKPIVAAIFQDFATYREIIQKAEESDVS